MPRFAANLSMLFTEQPILDRFKAAAEAGFSAVEFMFPYEFAARDIAAALKDNGLELVLHNLPAGDWAGGDRGIACQPDRVAEFRDGVDKAIDYATALGCPKLNCLTIMVGGPEAAFEKVKPMFDADGQEHHPRRQPMATGRRARSPTRSSSPSRSRRCAKPWCSPPRRAPIRQRCARR